ncbi:MAG: hypothetical protein PBV54_14245 [Achromobacter xylosoxidans]
MVAARSRSACPTPSSAARPVMPAPTSAGVLGMQRTRRRHGASGVPSQPARVSARIPAATLITKVSSRNH